MRPDDRFDIVHGPGTVDLVGTRLWLAHGCRGPAPIRQGFAAVLTHGDGSVAAAVSSRLEVALYYHLGAGRLSWATTVPELVRQLDGPPALDIQKLADLMVLYDRPDTTAIQGVHRLPIGHRLTWHPGWSAPQVVRWFNPAEGEDRTIHPRQAPELMRRTVRSAVAASLPAAGDVAATLSGGLDSSMVVGTAAEVLRGSGRTLHTVTHVPLPGTPDPSSSWEANDGPYAADMARCLPAATWQPLAHGRRTSPLTTLREVLPTTWLPALNPANLVWIVPALEYAAATGSRVLLTGATGNAPFSRDRAGLVRQLARRRRYGQVLTEIIRRRRVASWRSAIRSVVAEVAPEGATALVRRRRSSRSVAGRDPSYSERMPIRPESLSEEGSRWLHHLDHPAPLDHRAWVDFVLRDSSLATEPQLPDLGVWWSDPLSDPEVAALALRLPLEAWLCGGLDRGLAREAARGLVPDRIRLRRTRGAQAADVGQWIAGREQEYRDLLDRFTASPSVAQFIDLDRLEQALAGGLPTGTEAERWEETVGRAFGFGLYAVWYEDEVLGR